MRSCWRSRSTRFAVHWRKSDWRTCLRDEWAGAPVFDCRATAVQKQIGELDQQPKPADGCAGRRHRKDIHAKAAAKILLVKSHARGSPATTIFNLELVRET